MIVRYSRLGEAAIPRANLAVQVANNSVAAVARRFAENNRCRPLEKGQTQCLARARCRRQVHSEEEKGLCAIAAQREASLR